MRKCLKCSTEILDETCVCPLCLSVLEKTNGTPGTNIYPEISSAMRKYHLCRRLFSFILILLVVLLSVCNYLLYNSLVAYMIILSSALYLAVTFNYSIFHHANLAAKILVQTIGVQILVVIFDYALGYSGWSFNFVFPSICLLASVSIMLLILINRMNWQEYIMYQISMTVLSLSQLLLMLIKIIDWPILAIISVTISVLILIGTFIFGNRSVSLELSRRFHTK